MTSGDNDAAKPAADADAARDEEARAAEAARAAALARAEEAEREAASAQADLDAAAARLRAAQERAAAERAAAAPSKEDDADAFHHGEDDIDSRPLFSNRRPPSSSISMRKLSLSRTSGLSSRCSWMSTPPSTPAGRSPSLTSSESTRWNAMFSPTPSPLLLLPGCG